MVQGMPHQTPGEGHLLGVQQVIQALLHNVKVDIALLQLLQQIGHFSSLQGHSQQLGVLVGSWLQMSHDATRGTLTRKMQCRPAALLSCTAAVQGPQRPALTACASAKA